MSQVAGSEAPVIDIADIPEFSGNPYVAVNGNMPEFSDADKTEVSFETYSELDTLGRCGAAYANIGPDLMPTEERGEIGQVKPSGWYTVKYPDVIQDLYLYNRCHLIGYQLTAENANEKNLITGTRYLNIEGMLPFENEVTEYIKKTGNHVLYRVTPVFEGNNLVASGVQMEAESVEDGGEGVRFNVYCYNVQPGITIDYTTGESHRAEVASDSSASNPTAAEETTYILNTSSHKFHLPSCGSVGDIKEKNKKEFVGTREEVISMGYDPCQRCNP